LAVLDPARLQQALVRWVKALADLSPDLVALRGRPIRRPLDRAAGKGPIQVVKAWASAIALVRAQVHVDAKSHKITALPEWLRRLNLAGAVVTIDAMGCEVESTRQIQAQGPDDGLSFQDLQPGLDRDGDDLFPWLRGSHPLVHPVAFGDAEQVDGGHGRIETRRV
jgi:hypothetical protein